MQGREGRKGGLLGAVQMPKRDQVVGQWPRLVASPGMERRDKLCRLDQAGLKGEQAEEQMAIGGHRALRWISVTGWRLGPLNVGL